MTPPSTMPLDLRAVAAQLKASDASADYYYSGYVETDVAWALLAHVHALRATLESTMGFLPFGPPRERVIEVLAAARD